MLKQLGELQLGDLVEVTWLDASRGKLETVEELRKSGASGAEIDLLVSSGYFILWMDNNRNDLPYSSWLVLRKLKNDVTSLRNKLYRPQNIVSVWLRFHLLRAALSRNWCKKIYIKNSKMLTIEKRLGQINCFC